MSLLRGSAAVRGDASLKRHFAVRAAKGWKQPSTFPALSPNAAGSFIYCEGAFHGLTCGALSLMGSDFWKEGFGPLLRDSAAVPFDSIAPLEEKLATKKFAAFIVEPI